MIRLERALLLSTLAALGCAGAPPQPRALAAPAILAAAASPPATVAAATVAAETIAAPSRAAEPASSERVAFPAGWVRGAPTSLEAARPTASLTLGPQRRAVASDALRIADLPVIEETPRPRADQRPSAQATTPGEPSREIFITPGCDRASVRNHAFGFIKVGWFSEPIAAQSGGGVSLWHVKGGDGHDRYTLASWQTLDRTQSGALRLQETHAWFDMISCKAYEVRRMEALAQPIAGGLAYAFRTRCPSCRGPDAEKLHLLTPGGGWDISAFSHHEIPLGPGQSASMVLQLGFNAIRRFREGGAVTERATDALLGVDVVQGAGEAEPTAVVYVGDPPPSRF